jgi:hypothetical protein
MAKVVLTNAYVVFEGTFDFSDLISSITLSTVHDVLDVTPVQEGTIYKEVIAGVGTNSVQFDFYQDFANNSLEEFFGGEPGNALMPNRVGTKVSCVVRPINAPKSATNPEYQFEALVTEWTPLNAAVGQLSTVSVNWPISGAITKDITP